jgi:glycosyltransferase involved in cell wall biosynthesis
VLEAWAKGRPVVAHSIGALPEIITHDHDGLLVAANSVKQLSEAILKILLNSEASEAMGKAGFEKLKARYSKDRWRESIHPIFSSKPLS